MTLVSEEFYIIVPAEATNEVANPSFETGTTGYTSVGAGSAMARSSAQQRRGLWSLEITPASGVQCGAYFGTVAEVSGQTRTFSVDVKGVAGQAMRIGIWTTGGAALTETTFTANGYWQRVRVTRTGNSSTTRRLYVLRDSVASTAKFYIDGLYYSSIDGTYLDGDMTGFLAGEVEYRWVGSPHASASWRSGTTRSGGTMLRIKDYARIILHLGLGMATVLNLAAATASGNSSYQDTRTTDRDVIFRLAFTGTLDEIQASRAALIDAIRPDKVPVGQPLLIRYQGVDASGGDATEPVNLLAHYVDGLQNQPGSPGIERADVRFTAYLPMLMTDGSGGTALGMNTTVANFGNIGYRSPDGVWHAMGSGVALASGTISDILVARDGKVYVAGSFNAMGGVAGTAYIAYWDGAWHAMSSGLDNPGYSLAEGPDGAIYVGGNFSLAGGVAGTAHIAKWSGTTWSALGTGTAGGAVQAIAFGYDGNLYACGGFDHAGGVATAKVAYFDGAAWHAMGTGVTAGPLVYTMTAGRDGSIIIGGNFTDVGGMTGVGSIARWKDGTWYDMFDGTDGSVYALASAPDGTIYAGGYFTQAGHVGATNLARWNGSIWEPVGGEAPNSYIYDMSWADGGLYIGGDFDKVGGVSMPCHAAVFQNNIWAPIDLDVQDVSAHIYAVDSDPAGNLYVGGGWSGTTALTAAATVTSVGSATAYPIFTFLGPGKLWQVKNYSTGAAIYFRDLVIYSGEQVVLDLRPGHVRFTSNASFRKDLTGYILNGSSLGLALQRGTNNLSIFMSATVGGSLATIAWQDTFWSIDGAKR